MPSRVSASPFSPYIFMSCHRFMKNELRQRVLAMNSLIRQAKMDRNGSK